MVPLYARSPGGPISVARYNARRTQHACRRPGCAPFWYFLIPAMALQGVAIVTLFAPMHECVHRTAFASRAANDTVG